MKVIPMIEEFGHLTKKFDCNNDYLTYYIKSQNAFNNKVEVTYVLISSTSDIIGYYTIAAGSLDYLNNKQRERIGGSVQIINFAVDKGSQDVSIMRLSDGSNYYISDFLMSDCIRRVEKIRCQVGVEFITLNSTLEGEHFYLRNGFEYLEDDMILSPKSGENGCLGMYLALDIE